MISGHLVRYAAWQFGDFVRERGLALLLIGLITGFTTLAPIRAAGARIDAQMARTLIAGLLPQLVLLTAFVTLNGLVSNDRKLGYYRFLFSKPVSIPAYYAQLFVVYLVGFVAGFAVLLGLFAVAAAPISPVAPLAYCALAFLSIGGIAFFISTVVRHDWPVLAAVLLASSFLHSFWRDRQGWRQVVVTLLPPLHRLDSTLSDFLFRGSLNVQSLVWLLGYSAVFFIGGLYVLRTRRFG